jgi:hypothetical protein
MTTTTINNQVQHHHSSINSSCFPMAAEVDTAGRVEVPPSRQPFYMMWMFLLRTVGDLGHLPLTFSCLPPYGGPLNGFVFGSLLSACYSFSLLLLRLLIEPDISSFPSRFTGLTIEFI